MWYLLNFLCNPHILHGGLFRKGKLLRKLQSLAMIKNNFINVRRRIKTSSRGFFQYCIKSKKSVISYLKIRFSNIEELFNCGSFMVIEPLCTWI